MKYDVIALGELLMDFTGSGVSEQGNTVFEANPGGAPANVLAMLSRYGHRTAFIGKVGADLFGSRLKETLHELNIDTSNLIVDESVRTTLAFVHNDPVGEREFSFFRNPGADMMLTWQEVSEQLLTDGRIFHFGTLSMTNEPVRSATRWAVKTAKEKGALISFDPNLRDSLWHSKEEALEQVVFGLEHCDILKISDEELLWLTNITDFHKGVKYLQNQYQIPLVLLSLGREGSRAYYHDMVVTAEAFIQSQTVDTTGAGDTFLGTCLHFVLQYGLDDLTQDRMTEMLVYANAAAALITTRKGALRSMPDSSEVEEMVMSKISNSL
jgi:fructokinase